MPRFARTATKPIGGKEEAVDLLAVNVIFVAVNLERRYYRTNTAPTVEARDGTT